MYYRRGYGAPVFGGIFEDMLRNGFVHTADDAVAGSVPVNILETDKSYELQLIAPGITKEDFKISVDKNILTIAHEHKTELKEGQEAKALRTEFKFRSFKRSFTLNEKIDAGNITAKYADGILHVSLAKKEETVVPAKEIVIN